MAPEQVPKWRENMILLETSITDLRISNFSIRNNQREIDIENAIRKLVRLLLSEGYIEEYSKKIITVRERSDDSLIIKRRVFNGNDDPDFIELRFIVKIFLSATQKGSPEAIKKARQNMLL